MVITRTPLRISFVGGGSDVPQFSDEEPGSVVSASINKYVYVTVSDKYEGTYRAAYSQMETVERVEDLKHELVRETLQALDMVSIGREIHSIADIPGGTGLGSSSAFTVGLLRALLPQAAFSPAYVASMACKIEMERCKKAIGRQDQYATAVGGVNHFKFHKTGVNISPVECDYVGLGRHLLLVDTGLRRVDGTEAGHIIRLQQHAREDLRRLAALTSPFAQALTENDYLTCGRIMHEAWQIKAVFLRNPQIRSLYEMARSYGAWGGKLCGAGGGGFMLFMCPPEMRGALARKLDLRRVHIEVGVQGTGVVYSSALVS